MNIDTDFVYTVDKNGKYQSGGYSIQNELIGNFQPIESYDFDKNEIVQTGGNPFAVSTFNTIAVPAGLFILQRIMNNKYNDDINQDYTIQENNKEHIEESLYDKLFKLAQPNNINNSKKTINKTKKNTKSYKNKTLKNNK